jgi:predicted ATPase
VGRDDELEALDQALAASGRGPALTVLVEGDAGIGKTSLVEQWASRAAGDGAVVLSGRCDELGRDLPLQPVLDALDAHLAAIGAERAEAVLGAEAPTVGPLIGRAAAPVTPGGTGADVEESRAVLFAALLTVVHRLAEGRPVVLVVDDVHLAGPTTLAWLRMAGRRGRRLLVVATRRTGEGGELQPDRVITLGPLGEPATRQLVGAERARALYERSGGHPLFLVELAAADPGEDLPASIRDWAAARAEALGPAASTVTTAAVLGPDVDLDLLAQVMQLPAAVVLDHLETAVRGRLLEARANGFAFRHELVREALASVPAGARTAQLHREAARALSARPRQDPLAVAWHARLAGDASMAASAHTS